MPLIEARAADEIRVSVVILSRSLGVIGVAWRKGRIAASRFNSRIFRRTSAGKVTVWRDSLSAVRTAVRYPNFERGCNSDRQIFRATSSWGSRRMDRNAFLILAA